MGDQVVRPAVRPEPQLVSGEPMCVEAECPAWRGVHRDGKPPCTLGGRSRLGEPCVPGLRAQRDAHTCAPGAAAPMQCGTFRTANGYEVVAAQFQGWAQPDTDAPLNGWPRAFGEAPAGWQRDRGLDGAFTDRLLIGHGAGYLWVRPGYWIVRDPGGEFFVLPPDAFARIYRAADEEAP